MKKINFLPHLICLSLLNGMFQISARSQTDDIFYSSLNYAVQLGQFDGVASLKN
jgi:hypothetical protein